MADRDASESRVLPPGWALEEHSDWIVYKHGNRGAGVYQPPIGRDDWSWRSACGSGRAPTRPQAMCAALGIVVQRNGDLFCCNLVLIAPGEMLAFTDEDSCARAALEAFHARQQHPTTPTPEPVASVGESAPNAWDCRWCQSVHVNATGRCDATGAEIALQAHLDAAREACTPEMLAAADGYLHVVIADLRGKLERADRERVDAERGLDRRVQRMGELLAERDAATARATKHEQLYEQTMGELGRAHGENDRMREAARQREETFAKERSRATEAERLLRDIVEKQDAVIAAARQRMSEERQTEVSDATKACSLAIHAARKHLSTLPGSKDGE